MPGLFCRVAGAVTLAILLAALTPSIAAAASPESSFSAVKMTGSSPEAVLERVNWLILHQVEVVQRAANRTPVDDARIAERLVAFSERTVERLVRLLSPLTIEPVYVDVDIGETTVTIDPMKVAGG